VAPKSAVAGSDFTITLYDQDLDQNATFAEQAIVNVVSSRIVGSVYSVELTETAASSGVFTASMRSQDKATTALAEHAKVNVQEGDVLAVEYTDLSPVFRVARATARVETRSCGCSTITTDSESIAAGESLVVSVYDPDQNKQSETANNLEIVITNLDRPNQIYTMMQLRESAADSSVFTGMLQTRDNKIQPDTFVGTSD